MPQTQMNAKNKNTLFEFGRQLWQSQVYVEKPLFKSISQEAFKYKAKTDEQTIGKFNKRFSNKLNGALKTYSHTHQERERERDPFSHRHIEIKFGSNIFFLQKLWFVLLCHLVLCGCLFLSHTLTIEYAEHTLTYRFVCVCVRAFISKPATIHILVRSVSAYSTFDEQGAAAVVIVVVVWNFSFLFFVLRTFLLRFNFFSLLLLIFILSSPSSSHTHSHKCANTYAYKHTRFLTVLAKKSNSVGSDSYKIEMQPRIYTS